MIGAGVLATVSFLPVAQGEMVYDGSNDARALDRSAVRQSLAVSPRAESPVQVESAVEMTQIEPAASAQAVQAVPQARPVTIQTVPVQQTAAQPTVQPQIIVVQQPAQQQAVQQPVQQSVAQTQQGEEKLSKSEMLRRQRMREELRNEDALQERLEELRMRDEKGRTDKLVGAAGVTGQTGPDEAAKSLPVQEVVVAAPVGAQASKAVQQDQITTTQAAAVSGTTQEKEEKVSVSIMPRAGVSSMSANTGYDVKARYSAGIGFGIGISDHLGFDVGYTYSEFGVSMASNNPYVNYAQTMQQGYTANPTYETLAMRHHLADAGIKLYFLGSDARLRPFIGGGGGYARSSINYDQRIIDGLARMGLRNTATDYTSNAFLGYLSAGLDLRISKNVSVGTLFKYYTVLSARETQVNNGAMYTPGYYGGYNNGYYGYTPYATVDEKQMLGSSLIRSGFYSIMGGVSFNF